MSEKNNKDEIVLIQSVFKDNEELLKTIRSLFFGLELTKAEKDSVKSAFSGNKLFEIFSTRFSPRLSKDVPIGQTVDLWAGVDIRNLTKDGIYQAVMARDNLIKMTDKALALLKDPDGEPVDLSFNPLNDITGLQVSLVARNSFLSHVETQLGLIKLIANQPSETIEETKKRIAKNSNK